MTVDSHECFRQLSSAIFNFVVQTRTRVVESPSRVRERKRKLSSTLTKNLNTFKVDESAWESTRVHESFKPNESESLNSHRLWEGTVTRNATCQCFAVFE